MSLLLIARILSEIGRRQSALKQWRRALLGRQQPFGSFRSHPSAIGGHASRTRTPAEATCETSRRHDCRPMRVHADEYMYKVLVHRTRISLQLLAAAPFQSPASELGLCISTDSDTQLILQFTAECRRFLLSVEPASLEPTSTTLSSPLSAHQSYSTKQINIFGEANRFIYE